jgi:hypothetical protein
MMVSRVKNKEKTEVICKKYIRRAGKNEAGCFDAGFSLVNDILYCAGSVAPGAFSNLP